MSNPFHKGQRVQFSQKGREICRRTSPFKLGTVATNSQTEHFVSVRWDGSKNPSPPYHVDFIEPSSGGELVETAEQEKKDEQHQS